MKLIKSRILSEMEYLRELAAMYANKRETEAQRAALDAVEALRKLLEVSEQPSTARGEFDFAA